MAKDGTVSAYLVERKFKKVDARATGPITIGNGTKVVNGISAKQLIDNGQNSALQLNFKSVLFSVSVVDTKFSKDFKIFYSFSKDQNQVIGCEKFFNMTQLSNQNMIHLKVRISEKILHSAALHYLAANFQDIVKGEIKSDPDIEQKVSYCRSKREQDRRSDHSRAGSDERIREKGRDRYNNRDQDRHRYAKRPSTPPSELKRNYRLEMNQYREPARRDTNKYKGVRSYLNLTYYDFSFLIESNYINIEKEYFALDAVYRYIVKVLDDPGVTNRLIRGVRFNYLDLNDILSVASNNRKIFATSSEFQSSLSMEIERRLKAGIVSKSQEPTQPRRINYVDKETESLNSNVAESITKWLVEGNRHGKHERVIRKLKFQLEQQHEQYKKVTKKYEQNIKELIDDRHKHARRFIDEPKPRLGLLGNKRNSGDKKEETKTSVLGMMGIRKSGTAQSERNSKDKRFSEDDKDSVYSFRKKDTLKGKVIDEDFRARKIREREEELKKQKKYEDFKKSHEIENTKNLNIDSLKRRDELNKRRENGATYADRIVNVGIRTPMDPNKRRNTTTIVRGGRRNQGFWKSIANHDFCTIF